MSTRGMGIRLMWTHVDSGGGQKPDFLVNVISEGPCSYMSDNIEIYCTVESKVMVFKRHKILSA